ncbi:hypothetical protein MKW98_032543 [Papaver atlanticum]|uniref:Protein FAR1-RELATED SEQUENCE n=1 Tax=Papaver atlanticum TaxID=357466 RepID=A0AAD4XMG3_9MAGN|nr:hypothetical protein MKW98_032543 [Papaver atlanticum]
MEPESENPNTDVDTTTCTIINTDNITDNESLEDNKNNNSAVPESVSSDSSGEESPSNVVVQPSENPIAEDPTPIITDDAVQVGPKLASNDNGKSTEVDQIYRVYDELIEPEVGMIFDTAEEAFDFYNEYARKIGFRVRIQRTNMNKAQRNRIHRQVLVCSCEGTYKMIRKPRKRRETKRFGCLAAFEIKLITGDKYALIRFSSEHTHELVPPKFSHYLKTPRKLGFAQIGMTDKTQPPGTRPLELTLPEVAGVSDQNSLEQKTPAGFSIKGDAEFLLGYLKQKKQENKHFFYSFRINEDGKICGVFFCDAKSRRDYGLFGDSVCFDTMFKTNNFDMVCVPVVGLSNHGLPILFGCGLLDGETTDAVAWLFMTFLEAMGGKKPESVFTDHSAAISDAVGLVFPESHHGLCLWHIFLNASKQLTKVVKASKTFAPQFKAWIYEQETVEEFDRSWNKLLEDFDLRDNEWLQGLYELREKWAQAYSLGHFSAAMTTSERCENISKFLKAFFSNGSILLRDFLDQYSKAMADRYEKEREAEKKTQLTTPNWISGWSVEREASKVYTREIFYGFQDALQKTIDLSLELEKDDGTIRAYRATELEGQKTIHSLVHNISEQSVSCTCRKFEFDGILCPHALKLFRDLQYKSLPPRYYLKRWTRKVTDEDVFDPSGELIVSNNDPTSTARSRYDDLTHISQSIVAKGLKSDEMFTLIKSLLQEVKSKADAHITSKDERRVAIQKNMPNPHQNLVSNLNEEATQDVFGMMQQQQPDYSQNGWQWMNRQAIHAQGIHPQDIIPGYNFAGSQQQRQFHPNELFMSQQGSSSQIPPPEMPH